MLFNILSSVDLESYVAQVELLRRGRKSTKFDRPLDKLYTCRPGGQENAHAEDVPQSTALSARLAGGDACEDQVMELQPLL